LVRRRRYEHFSKCRKPHTQRHRIIYQKTLLLHCSK
jgi:hypothetical protein